MIKYRLVREYPNCQPLNTVYFIDDETKQIWEENKRLISYHISSHISYKDFIKFINFFEEIKETNKEYEVLSYYFRVKDKTDLVIYNRHSALTFQRPEFVFSKTVYESELKDKALIYSIKRLSDNEIFTIGDKIGSVYDCQFNDYKNTGIKEIRIEKDKVSLITDANGGGCKTEYYLNDKGKGCGGLGWGFQDVIKKKKLFTTEDGIDIFEGDTFYWLDKGLQILNSGYSKLVGTQHNTLYFSTKEKAEQYIIENKKCLSLIDCLTWATIKEEARPHLDLEKLTNIVKLKTDIK